MCRLLALSLAVVFFGQTMAAKQCILPHVGYCSHMSSDQSLCLCAPDSYNLELCCNFKNLPGKVERDLIRYFGDVTVIDASVLEYMPDCSRKQNVTFINVQHGMLLNVDSEGVSRCNVNVHLRSSSFKTLLAIESLHMVDSELGMIAFADEFEDFRIENSSIVSVANFSMVYSVFVIRECFSARDSIIYHASHWRISCDVVMDYTTMHSIDAIVLYSFRITSSVIGNVTTNGLTLKKGWHRMRNVTFGSLAEQALVFDTEADVSMMDISIQDCQKPCIKMKGAFVHVHNLTINGEAVTNFMGSPYVFVAPAKGYTNINTNNPVCTGNTALLTCSLLYYDDFPVIFTPSRNYTEIKVRDHQNVGIFTDCFQMLTLTNILAYVRDKRAYSDSYVTDIDIAPVQDSNAPCPRGNKQLNLDGARLRFLHMTYLEGLLIQKSAVGSVEVMAPIYWVNIANANMHSIEKLEYYKNKSSESEFQVDDLTIVSIYHLHLRYGASFYRLDVRNKIVNLTIDLETPTQSVVIEESTIDTIFKNGISIVRGVLSLDQVAVRRLDPDAILVHKEGKLLITELLGAPNSLGCSEHGASIVVDARYQVVYTGVSTPPWLRHCTRVRSGIEFKQDLEPGYVELEPKMCVLKYITQLTCSDIQAEGVVLGGNNNFDDVSSLVIETTKNLIVKKHCLDLLHISHVTKVVFERVENSCYSKVIVGNISTDNVWNNMEVFAASYSEVKFLRPTSPVIHFSLYHAHVHEMTVMLHDGQFEEGKIETIVSLTVQGSLKIDNVTIGTVLPSSVFVDEKGNLTINGCHITDLSVRSFTVHGVLSIQNTVIEGAFNMGVIMHPNAVVHMNNVSIGNDVPHLFKMENQENFDLDDVTLDSKPVRLIQNLVLVHKKKETDSDTNVDPLTPSPGKPTDEQSSAIENVTPTTTDFETSTTVHTTPVTSTTSTATVHTTPVTSTTSTATLPTTQVSSTTSEETTSTIITSDHSTAVTTPYSTDVTSKMTPISQDTVSSVTSDEEETTETESMIEPSAVVEPTRTRSRVTENGEEVKKAPSSAARTFVIFIVVFCIILICSAILYSIYRLCKKSPELQNVEIPMGNIPVPHIPLPSHSSYDRLSTHSDASEGVTAAATSSTIGTQTTESSSTQSSSKSLLADPGADTKDPASGSAVPAKETSPAQPQDDASNVPSEEAELLE